MVFLLLDYDEKAEDAVDYEDFDEQYEGPEIQIVSEEDYLLPKKEYFSAEVSLAALKPIPSPFDDENYDEDEELEKEHEEVDKETEVKTTSLSGLLYLILDVIARDLYKCYVHCQFYFTWTTRLDSQIDHVIHVFVTKTIHVCLTLMSLWLECFELQID